MKDSDLLLMELGFDLVMLCLKSKGDQLENFWKRGLRIQEAGLDVRVRGFDAQRGSMVKVCDFLGPSIQKPRRKGDPGLLNVSNEVARIDCRKP